eukprot:1496131-Rhodomonas_salina.2
MRKNWITIVSCARRTRRRSVLVPERTKQKEAQLELERSHSVAFKGKNADETMRLERARVPAISHQRMTRWELRARRSLTVT